MNRIPHPSTAAFFSFFLVSCLTSYCSFPVKIVILSLFLIGTMGLVIFRRIRSQTSIGKYVRVLLAALLAASVASLISLAAFDLYAEHIDSYAGQKDTVTVQILETDYALSYTTRYRARIRESEHLPKGTQLMLDTPLSSLPDGTLLTGTVTYISLKESSSSSFDAVAYYLPKQVMIMAEGDALTVTGQRKSVSPSRFFSEANEWLSARLMAHLDYEAGGLASAVLLGNKDGLTDALSRDFRRIGISHLLVISGTHFSVLVSLLERAMRRYHVNRRARSLLNMGMILLLMCLTGLTPSVLRAGLMHLLAQLSIYVSRKPNRIHSFALSGSVIVLLNPYLSLDCGLQLSFIATYCCLQFIDIRWNLLKPLRRRIGRKMWRTRRIRFLVSILESIGMTTFVTLGTLPLIWLYFGEVSLISIPVNLLAVPIVTALMMLCILYLALYPLRLFIVPMAAAINGFCILFRETAGFFARFDWVILPLGYEFTLFFLAPLTGILLLLPLFDKRNRIRAMGTAAALCILLAGVIGIVRFTERDLVQISYVNAKKNDGIVLKSENKCLLADMSDGSFGFSYRLTREMEQLHSCEIEGLLLTHYHNKHVQLLSRLAEREILRNLIIPKPQNEDETALYRVLLETAAEYSVAVTTIAPGETFLFGDVEIQIYDRTYLKRSSHPITALRLDAFDQRVMLVSCSFNEGNPTLSTDLTEADFAIFGAHSPVYKKTFDLVFDQPNAVWMCEDAKDHMSENTRSSLPVGFPLVPDEVNRITIRPADGKSSRSQRSGTAE